MKTLLTVFLASLALTCFGCEMPPAVDDAGITTKVKTQLAADGDTSAMKIGVDTNNGVVTLTGTVPTQTEKAEAERIAKATEGVKSVHNNIMIDPNSLGATNAEEKAREAASDVGTEISDASILTKIKTQYLAEGIVGTNVDVTNGAVMLKGSVENAAEKSKAEEIARKTEGVKSVTNSLTIKQG